MAEDPPALETLALLMRDAREALGLTQGTMDRRIGEPAQSTYRAETGRHLPHKRFMDAWTGLVGDLPGVWHLYDRAKASAERSRTSTHGHGRW